MTNGEPRVVRLTTPWHCGLHLLNSSLVSLSCVLIVRPRLVERAECLGTTDAWAEVGYHDTLVGVGLLIGTTIALVSQGVARSRAHRTGGSTNRDVE